jgi:hypothetical protein
MNHYQFPAYEKYLSEIDIIAEKNSTCEEVELYQ